MLPWHHHLKNAFIPHEGNDYRPHALRREAIHVYAALLLLAKVVVVAFVGFYAGPARPSAITPDTIITQTNEARTKSNLAVLRANQLLNRAAQSKADDMVRQHYFAHYSPKGTSPWYWFKQAGYSYRYAGENLAIDFVQSEDIVAAWLKSPSHRRNLLSTKFKDIGVAVASGKVNGVQSLVVVQMFGTPVTKTLTKAAVAAAPPAKLPSTAPTPPAEAVLGETAATPSPPAVPTIDSPTNETLLPSSQPDVSGTAQPGSQVLLFVDGQSNGQAVAAANGAYTVKPATALSDGRHRFQVQAKTSVGQSDRSLDRSVTIDVTPPTVADEGTYALFSAVSPQRLDIWVTASDDAASARCDCGQAAVALSKHGRTFVGRMTLDSNRPTLLPRVVVADRVGNEVRQPLVDPDLFTTGVVTPTASPTLTALRVVIYSRTFLGVVFSLMLMLAMINIFIHWERQHHPSIVGSLLIIYLAGALLLL